MRLVIFQNIKCEFFGEVQLFIVLVENESLSIKRGMRMSAFIYLKEH